MKLEASECRHHKCLTNYISKMLSLLCLHVFVHKKMYDFRIKKKIISGLFFNVY